MYTDVETQTSYEYLQKVVSILEEPICIIGGWAVFLTVNPLYRNRFGNPYLGSKDIDLGFHLEEDWTKKKLEKSSFSNALKRLREDGYENVGFRMVKHLDRETGIPLTKSEQYDKPLYNQFQMYIDLMVDNIPSTFKETFHMNPIDEPLLKHVFANEKNRVELEEFSRKLYLPTPAILLSTKLRALPGRNKKHKRMKDIHDIVALLLFSKNNLEIRQEALQYISMNEYKTVLTNITPSEKKQVANTFGVQQKEIETAFANLMKVDNSSIELKKKINLKS